MDETTPPWVSIVPVAVKSWPPTIEDVLSFLRAGFSWASMAAQYNLSDPYKIWAWRRSNPQLREQIDEALLEGAEAQLAYVQTIPYIEPDTARARIKADVTLRALEMRFPYRFGKKTELTLTGTLNLRQAIADARTRVWQNRQLPEAYRQLPDVYVDATDAVSVALPRTLVDLLG